MTDRFLSLVFWVTLGTIIALVAHSCFSAVKTVSADHGAVRCGGTGMKACLATASPFVRQYVKPGHEFTWCVNPRGLQYPNFRSQTRTVMERWAADLRLPAREVAYPTSQVSLDCIARNDMLDNHPCGGCGAHVYTQNLPVLIEYNARTGYVHWETTVGHEFGHAACLEDEHYDRENFVSYILTYGEWIHGEPTVMDVGTPYLAEYAPIGIWYPTEYDLRRCEETLGRQLIEQDPGPEWSDECIEYIPGAGCGRYRFWSDEWFWGIPMGTSGREMIHRWSVREPSWRCIAGCP